MDKETLSNYGWIVICVLVMVVMIALATPFGSYISEAVQSTTKGLFDVNKSAFDSTGLINIDNQEFGVPNMNHGADEIPSAPVDHNGTTIPKGATFTKTNGTVYGEGDTFPTFENGDIYTYGDYKYQDYVRTEMMGPMTITKTAIGVSVIDKSKTSYGEILSSIAGKPVTEMSGTFMNCTALKVAPAIPNSIKIMPSAFSGCTSLTTAPVIPSGITSLYMTFKDCTSLTGTIEVNVTSSLSANLAMTENSCGACFYGVNFETQNLKLTGSASDSLLDAMGTQSNTYKYCRICNGICSYGKINDSSVHQ